MTAYRLKPANIEAVQFDGATVGDPAARPAWVPAVIREPGEGVPALLTRAFWYFAGRLYVGTPTGDRAVQAGEWIIRNSDGDLSVMDPARFAATYEPDE